MLLDILLYSLPFLLLTASFPPRTIYHKRLISALIMRVIMYVIILYIASICRFFRALYHNRTRGFLSIFRPILTAIAPLYW